MNGRMTTAKKTKRRPPGRCICDFPLSCGGSGTIACSGCGGDQCVCAACHGNGERECPGCSMCEGDSGPNDDYDEQDEATE